MISGHVERQGDGEEPARAGRKAPGYPARFPPFERIDNASARDHFRRTGVIEAVATIGSLVCPR